MANELTDLAVAETPSTVLDDRKHNEQQKPIDGLDAPEEKPKSTRDAIAKAFDEADAKDEPAKVEDDEAKPEKTEKTEKTEAKPAKVEKAEKAEKAGEGDEDEDQPEPKGEKRGVPEKDDATGQDGDKKARPSEGRQHQEPPARFLPKAKEAWANVPNVVKGEIDRISREHEAEVSQYRESHENWQKIAKFDQMAKANNATVSDALERYTAVDGLLQSNPVEGIRQVLATIGITPQQYADYIAKNPQAAQAPQQRAPDPAAQRTSSEIETLKAEMTAMRQEQAAREIIEPFKATHSRYAELQDDIAFFLSSGKIPTSLSPSDRLEAAYDMAERINPRSIATASDDDDDAPASPRPVVDPRGQKSIKGAPSAGFDPAQSGRVKNRRDAIKAAMAEFGA